MTCSSFQAAEAFESAKAEKSAKVRCNIVRRCLALGSQLPKARATAFRIALALFDDTSQPTLAARGRVLINNPQAISMAMEWDAQGLVGTLAMLAELAPDLSQTDYATFRSASFAVAELCEQGFEVKNVTVKAAVALIQGFQEKWGSAPWACDLCERAVTSRLMLKGMDKIKQSIAEHAGAITDYTSLYTLLRPFVEPRGGRRKSDLSVSHVAHSDWYLEIKARMEEECEKAKAETVRMEIADAESKSFQKSIDKPPIGVGSTTNAPTQQPEHATRAQGEPQSSSADSLAAKQHSPAAASETNSGSQFKFCVGAVVKANAPRKPEFHGYSATLQSPLSNHWWVQPNVFKLEMAAHIFQHEFEVWLLAGMVG